MPRGGMVRLDPSRGSSLTMILNKEPDRGGGVGGHQAVERSLRRPAKWFKAQPDDTISFDCTIDIDAIGGPSVERRVRVLRDMGQPSDTEDPPTITVDGDIWDDDKNVTWVMQDWSLGARLWNSDGTLRRQQVTVSLERFNPLDEIQPIRIKSTRKGGRRRRHVVVARGSDTLRAIALRELGDQARWKDIQKWNKTKLRRVDPDQRLRTGLHLTIR